MPLLKRKPVLMHPLPSHSAIVQPLPTATHATTAAGEPSPDPAAMPPQVSAEPLPQDGKDDDEQLDRLLTTLHDPLLSAPPHKRGQKMQHPNGNLNGAMAPHGLAPIVLPPAPVPGYKVKNVDVFYIPETGEMFLDYESYIARRTFYEQPLFQCEVSGKSSLTYFKARENEHREVQQLHARFPRQLKKAVLQSVQFQIEGKLETLADKVFERFVNRFFDDEKVFVDVQGDKYLARIVKTFPPKNLVPPPTATPPAFHPYATNLSMGNEDVLELDDPMKYFYQVRLIEEGGEGEIAPEGIDEEKAERWQGSVMEVQADKISRDRINFSRAMLKRFIRDCVSRDAAIFSPWIVKPPVARRYGIPSEITDEVRASIQAIRDRQMDKRKRDREERLGILHSDEEELEEEEAAPPAKKKRMTKAEREKEEREKADASKEEEAHKKRRGIKYPIEDLLMEYAPDRDGPAGRIEVRPVPKKDMPFGEEFEEFLFAWSFLNVMGKPLGLSPFTIDEFEQSLYHNDPWTAPVPLLTEVHAVLLNAIMREAGNENVRPQTAIAHDRDVDEWEGTKGATIDTLRPVAAPLAETWAKKELSHRDNRKGWESVLVGCLWERAKWEFLPNYLDNILHLTFEDKPAPTRPTWSTGPSSNSATGLVKAQPEKRYVTLHFLHKLRIINFLIDLANQTEAVRAYMEESTQALTEVRKEQIEVRRDYRKVRAAREAIEPKDGKLDEEEGDVPKIDIPDSRAASPNGVVNGTATNTEHDELDDSMMGDGEETRSRASSPAFDTGPKQTASSRRRAMKEKAAEREAEEAMRVAREAKDREESKAKRAENKVAAAERKRLLDEETALAAKLHQLEQDFRRYLYTLRTRPLGLDRFGNKYWWVDGLGSAPLYGPDGKVQWGTGRLYVQGSDASDPERVELPLDMTRDQLEARREKEEGGHEGRVDESRWGCYDTVAAVEEFYNWLNPRGTRELHLQRALKQWWAEITGGISRRRIASGLELAPESDEPVRRVRPARRAAGGAEEEREGYLGWKNRRATGKGE